MKLNALNMALWHSGNCLCCNHAINGRSDFFQRSGRPIALIYRVLFFRGMEILFEIKLEYIRFSSSKFLLFKFTLAPPSPA